MPGKYKVSPANERRALGRTFDSKAEMMYALNLQLMVEQELIRDYICQPKLWHGVPEYTYTPDFLVIPFTPENKEGGSPYYVDVCGVMTPSKKRHMKMWKEHGRLQLLLVKHKGNGKFEEIDW